ncbi:MAG: hypothetical protein ACFFDT_06195 [Candidatus Hodarchaeota archaeon]
MVEEEELSVPIIIPSKVRLRALFLANTTVDFIYHQSFGATQTNLDTVNEILFSIRFFGSEILSDTSLVQRGLLKAKKQGTDLIINRGEQLIGVAVVERDNHATEQEEDALISWLLNFITVIEEECVQEQAELTKSVERYDFREARRALQTKIGLLLRK